MIQNSRMFLMLGMRISSRSMRGMAMSDDNPHDLISLWMPQSSRFHQYVSLTRLAGDALLGVLEPCLLRAGLSSWIADNFEGEDASLKAVSESSSSRNSLNGRERLPGVDWPSSGAVEAKGRWMGADGSDESVPRFSSSCADGLCSPRHSSRSSPYQTSSPTQRRSNSNSTSARERPDNPVLMSGQERPD